MSRLVTGQYVAHHEPLNHRLMNRIMLGANKTKELTLRHKNFLRSQRLIPYLNDTLPFNAEPFKPS